MNALAQAISGNWCEQLVWTLLHSIWQVGVIGLAVLAALRIGKSARARSAACAAGLVAMAASLPVTYLLVRTDNQADPAVVAWDETSERDDGAAAVRIEEASGREKHSFKDELSDDAAEVPQPFPAIVDNELSGVVSTDPRQGLAPSQPEQHSRDTLAGIQPTLMRIAALAYLAGVICFGLRSLRGVTVGWRLRSKARRHVDTVLTDLVSSLAVRLGSRLRPAVAYCADVSVPVVSGVIRPMILLPASLATGLSNHELESILLHEVMHLCRRDHLVLVVQRVVETLLFFHPVMWWVSRRLSAERELACDDAVLAAGTKPVCYAESLLKVAQFGRSHALQSSLLAASGAGGQLKHRVVRILHGTDARNAVAVPDIPTSASKLSLGLNMFQHAFGLLVLVAIATFLAADWNGVFGQPVADAEAPASMDDDDNKAADEDAAEDLASPAHLLTIVRRGDHSARKDELLLVTIPAADAADQKPTVRTVTSEANLQFLGFECVGVYGGHVLVINAYQLIAIDLESGERRLVHPGVGNAVLAGDRAFILSPQRAASGKPPTRSLKCIELSSGVVRELMKVPSSQPGFVWQGESGCSMAPNVDGSRVVVTESVPPDDEVQGQWTCRLAVIDVETNTVARSVTELPLRIAGTGAGHHAMAPKLAWVDDRNVVAVAPVTSKDAFGEGRMAPGMQVTRFDAATLESEVVCKLPKFGAGLHDPLLARRDGSVFVRLGQLGQYRIDLAAKRLIEDGSLGRHYQLRGPAKNTSLWYGDQELSPRTGHNRVFLSPDGRRVAWLPWDVNERNVVIQAPMELSIHDSVRGVRSVMREWFIRRWQSANDPSTNLCLWVTGRDLKRHEVFDDYPTAKDPNQSLPRAVSPDIKECVEVELKTDRPEYFRHEPVELTVTVKNISETPIKYESRRLLHGGRPFDLSLKSDRSSSRIELFHSSENMPKEEFIEIAPGQTRSFKRMVEIENLGEQSFVLRFEHWGTWKGYLTASATITVSEGGDATVLLKQKFDRLMALCLAEYAIYSGDSNPASAINVARLWQLGTDGAPLLVDYLRTCDDPLLHARLLKGLEYMADESTLPYLKSALLRPDVEHAAQNLVGVLWRLHDSNQPESEPLALLILAGKLPNARLRLEVVKRFCHIVDTDVDAFMQTRAKDPDPRVAETAARFVAARQHLSLTEWLDSASSTLTSVNLAASRSIVRDLEKTWKEEHGDIPDGSFEDVSGDAEKLKQYRNTIRAWHAWTLEHPRTSDSFFDEDRKKAAGPLHFIRPNRAPPAPIVLKPSASVAISDD